MLADAYKNKSYDRSFDFSSMTDAEVEKIFDDVRQWNVNVNGQRKRNYRNARMKKIWRSRKFFDVPTLQRWMKDKI